MIDLEVPAGWRRVALKDVAALERRMLTAEEIPGGTTYVGLEHLDGEGRFLAPPTIQTGDVASTKYAFSAEHLLYGKLRPYLR